MKLWLSDEYAVERDHIVGIFDMDTATVSHPTREMLKKAEKEKNLTVTTGEIPVSFVVSEEKGNIKVFFTRNASRVLCRRAERRGI